MCLTGQLNDSVWETFSRYGAAHAINGRPSKAKGFPICLPPSPRFVSPSPHPHPIHTTPLGSSFSSLVPRVPPPVTPSPPGPVTPEVRKGPLTDRLTDRPLVLRLYCPRPSRRPGRDHHHPSSFCFETPRQSLLCDPAKIDFRQTFSERSPSSLRLPRHQSK